ncbi:MAG: hypothetical protein ACSHX3_00450 [Litorimonas sp.]
MIKPGFIIASIVLLAGCGSMPDYGPHTPHPPQSSMTASRSGAPARMPSYMTPIPGQGQNLNQSPLLTDRVTYSQKDPRWGQDTLGRKGGSLAREGCVLTSAAMAMTNLGYDIDPGELNRRLTQSDNLTPSGLLKWKGIADVSGGAVKATFYETVSEPLIQSCLVKGDYPLVRFYLPNGRSHWAMILGRSENGYHMRDPLRVSNSPLVFPRDSSAFKSLRCIGRG